jgi:hypothetical protein
MIANEIQGFSPSVEILQSYGLQALDDVVVTSAAQPNPAPLKTFSPPSQTSQADFDKQRRIDELKQTLQSHESEMQKLLERKETL